MRGHGDKAAKVYLRDASPHQAAKLTAMTAMTDKRLQLGGWPIEHGASSRMASSSALSCLNSRAICLSGISTTRRCGFSISPAATGAFCSPLLQTLLAPLTPCIGPAWSSATSTTPIFWWRRTPPAGSSTATASRLPMAASNSPVTWGRPSISHRRCPTHIAGWCAPRNHDNFGLAVLIFHLLFAGRHPFAGIYLGVGEPPQLETAIKHCMYAYAADHGRTLMQPGQPSLPISALPASIIHLFEAAFSPTTVRGGRPTANDWVMARGLSPQPCISAVTIRHTTTTGTTATGATSSSRVVPRSLSRRQSGGNRRGSRQRPNRYRPHNRHPTNDLGIRRPQWDSAASTSDALRPTDPASRADARLACRSADRQSMGMGES